jgi:hypothetical protein
VSSEVKVVTMLNYQPPKKLGFFEAIGTPPGKVSQKDEGTNPDVCHEIVDLTHIRTGTARDFLRLAMLERVKKGRKKSGRTWYLDIPIEGKFNATFFEQLRGHVLEDVRWIQDIPFEEISYNTVIYPLQQLYWLSTGLYQRALTKQEVDVYGRAMCHPDKDAVEAWGKKNVSYWHQDGWMGDGKTRAWAGLFYNKPYRTRVISGCTDNEIIQLDQGKKRSKSDALSIYDRLAQLRGESPILTPDIPFANITTMLINTLAYFGKCYPTMFNTVKGTQLVLEAWRPELVWYKQHMMPSTASNKVVKTTCRSLRQAWVSIAFMLYERRCRSLPEDDPRRNKATELVHNLVHGQNCGPGTIELVIKNYLDTDKTPRARDKTASRDKDDKFDITWKLLGLFDKHFKGQYTSTVSLPGSNCRVKKKTILKTMSEEERARVKEHNKAQDAKPARIKAELLSRFVANGEVVPPEVREHSQLNKSGYLCKRKVVDVVQYDEPRFNPILGSEAVCVKRAV